MRVLRFLRVRLNERSTWVSLGAGVTAASVLPPPWSFVLMAIAVIGVVLPDGPVSDRKRGSK